MKLISKIGLKLIIAVSLTTVLILSIYAYLNIAAQEDVLIEEVERHANQLSETIKKSTRFDMLANRREHIYNIINTIGEEPNIRSVRVLNKLGEVIYSADSLEIGTMLDKNAEACYVCHAENQPLEKLSIGDRTRIYKPDIASSRQLGIINPIYNEPSCWEAECHAHSSQQSVLGVLDITVGLQPVEKQIASSQIRVLIFAVVSIVLISFIILMIIRRIVDKPVKELVKATNTIAVGNLNYRIEYKSSDELGKLGESFNNMTKKLSDMRQQLLQSEKMASLGQLAAGVAHEINNPLTGVLTYSSFLLKRTKDNPELQEDLNVIVRETKRSREIVKGLLDFARQSTPKRNRVNINEVIERSVTVINNQLKLNRVELKTEFADLPETTADYNQLQQVFINLLVNGVDAIGSGGGTINIKTYVISLSPYGIKQIKQASCPNGHSLIDNDYRIEGMPSLKVKVKSANVEGIINLDPVYGKFRHYYGVSIKDDSDSYFHCPECDVLLIDKNMRCPECDSPVYSINIPNQGEVRGCMKQGCKWQKWESIDQRGKQSYIEVKVIDNGSGIPKDKLYKIFDPFFTTKGQKGTGLGLSVIWGIIDNHNGRIFVESQVNKGTTFTIRLPVI
ncbi:MAG: HAMP domain-containing protein [Melioribacteraceae bacterium]|nr:HAMP domain-containing protein [Melioribacteraceae bacterium]MCF8356157.1 HAMP domain-containing protein [Melioribacteraceae bacterium]MCF8392323.1 HAMP domain-containing protein [Melioribacteraceae bacterium]MCF8417655.1 HAMP domain-containing protein [Melioribacteraceae bacterium]